LYFEGTIVAIGSKKEMGAMNKEYSWQNKPEEKQP
jgi:hypothetical protein